MQEVIFGRRQIQAAVLPILSLVTDPDTLIATYSVTGTTCIGCTNGSITINATGGVPPYQYSIQPSAGRST
ncbi:MAG: SprB repeat-containing protein [Bacteroidia bacterium]